MTEVGKIGGSPHRGTHRLEPVLVEKVIYLTTGGLDVRAGRDGPGYLGQLGFRFLAGGRPGSSTVCGRPGSAAWAAVPDPLQTARLSVSSPGRVCVVISPALCSPSPRSLPLSSAGTANATDRISNIFPFAPRRTQNAKMKLLGSGGGMDGSCWIAPSEALVVLLNALGKVPASQPSSAWSQRPSKPSRVSFARSLLNRGTGGFPAFNLIFRHLFRSAS